MPSKSAGSHPIIDRILSLEIVRVTERAAVAAARLRGRGAEKKSDQAAVDAMRRELSGLAIDGTGVIGEGGDGGGADVVHRREGRHRIRAESISRSIRSRARRFAPRICRAL